MQATSPQGWRQGVRAARALRSAGSASENFQPSTLGTVPNSSGGNPEHKAKDDGLVAKFECTVPARVGPSSKMLLRDGELADAIGLRGGGLSSSQSLPRAGTVWWHDMARLGGRRGRCCRYSRVRV